MISRQGRTGLLTQDASEKDAHQKPKGPRHQSSKQKWKYQTPTPSHAQLCDLILCVLAISN
jgi:hypothetical protein